METEEEMEEDFHPHVTSERDQRDRQEEEWSILASVGGRGENILVG